MEEIIAKYLPSSPCHSGARRSGKNHQGESSNPLKMTDGANRIAIFKRLSTI